MLGKQRFVREVESVPERVHFDSLATEFSVCRLPC